MAQRIRDRVALYAREGHGDVLKLAGQDDIYRLRIGDWRILFGFDDGGETVVVLRVLPRNERTYQGR